MPRINPPGSPPRRGTMPRAGLAVVVVAAAIGLIASFGLRTGQDAAETPPVSLPTTTTPETGTAALSSAARITRNQPDTPMAVADFYVAPRAMGAGDGSSPADPVGIDQLPVLVRQARPGSVIELIASQGEYRLNNPISISAGGTVAAPIMIRGPLRGGPAVLAGDRTNPYRSDGNVGTVALRLEGGADHLHFANLRCENVGNGCFKAVGPISDLTISHASARNVRRFFETGTSRDGRDATVSGLTISAVTVDGFSKGAIRLGHATNDVLLVDIAGDSQRQDGDNFAMGIHLTDTVHDVRIERVSMDNARDTLHDYWNGDGFTTEAGVTRVHFVDTSATGNTDAGYDLKSSLTVLERTSAVANKRNYRFKGVDVHAFECRGIDPLIRGGTGSQNQVQLGDGAEVVMTDCDFVDNDPDTVVFEVDRAGRLLITGGRVDHAERAELSRDGGGAELVLTEVEVVAG